MSKCKKVKLAFHAVVANYCGNLALSYIILDAATCLAIRSMSMQKYLQTTIPNYNKASKPILVPPRSFNNVIPSLGGV
jgi:hypothetical protein